MSMAESLSSTPEILPEVASEKSPSPVVAPLSNVDQLVDHQPSQAAQRSLQQVGPEIDLPRKGHRTYPLAPERSQPEWGWRNAYS